MSTYAFSTDRLRVVVTAIQLSERDISRDAYLGFDPEWPLIPVVVATVVHDVHLEAHLLLDYVYTVEGRRHRGLAREMLLGIERHTGNLLSVLVGPREGQATGTSRAVDLLGGQRPIEEVRQVLLDGKDISPSQLQHPVGEWLACLRETRS